MHKLISKIFQKKLIESSEMDDDCDYVIELVLLGDSGVGKSCLLSRFVEGSFITRYATDGAEFMTRTIEMDQKKVKLEIWDIGGQGTYLATKTSTWDADGRLIFHYTEVAGFLLVYDVTRESSFENIKNWIRHIEHEAGNVNVILVGNKADMDKSYREVVPTSKGQALADEYGIKFFETSAKTNLNVEEAFFSIARDVKRINFGSASEPEITQLEDTQEQKLNGIKETEESLKKAKEEKEMHIYALKKAKEEKETLSYENEQLNQHISTLKYDMELALLEKAQIQDERDNAVKEAEELRRQMKLAQASNFTWQELNKSTLGFSESLIIGEGGYGRVYKGNLRGTDVAIKVLNSDKTAPLSAFKQEVAILTTFRHPNLVTLIGVCYEYSALVYEFLPNGSLEDHLSPKNNITPLTWQVRTRIMHEICLALIFLHSNKPNIVIHGDLKPDNVLLDANFVSKLGDFGISRLIKQSETDITAYYMTDNIVGTPGYMDPDFIYNGKLTEKSDVFSFGVIILRLLTGQSARGVVCRVEDSMLNETLDIMIDKSAGEWPLEQAKKLAALGLRCTEMSRNDRPNLFNEIWPIIESLQRNI